MYDQRTIAMEEKLKYRDGYEKDVIHKLVFARILDTFCKICIYINFVFALRDENLNETKNGAVVG